MSFQRIQIRPAWSIAFARQTLRTIRATLPLEQITPEWAWGGSTGRGIRVAVVDSGIDADHPAIGAPLAGYAATVDAPTGVTIDITPHQDAYGHGTACAGIIRSIAPDCELFSVKVLGPVLAGKAAHLAAGLRWAIENGMQVCNLSLGTTLREYYGVLHELTDQAYFRGIMLVTAANNRPVPSFPSLYGSVISVAAHDGEDPYRWYYNPRPPVEFGAPGINVRVAWLEGAWIRATGNSYAAPHLSGILARILGKHPELNVFQAKSILWALADNVSFADDASDR